MMNPSMPTEVAVTPIASQRLPTLCGLFQLRQFNGIALARRLHMVAQIVNAFIHAASLIGSFVERSPSGIVISIIFLPISLLVFAASIRVSAEVIVSVLLLPAMLAKQNRGVEARVMDDLTTFGVPEGTIAAEHVTGAAV